MLNIAYYRDEISVIAYAKAVFINYSHISLPVNAADYHHNLLPSDGVRLLIT
jgi:hypothetical protein